MSLSDTSGNAGSHFTTVGGVASKVLASSSVLSAVSRFTWRIGSLAVGLGAVIAGILYVKQDSLLYFPEIGGLPRRPGQNPRPYRSPAEHQIPFESHKIRCDDGVHVHAWLLMREAVSSKPSKKSSLPTLLFFHGNAGNIGLRLPNAIQMLQFLNANILLVEYRGYGDSDNAKINEAGLNLDAQAALRFALQHDRIDPESIFVFGRSLGGAVAISLADYAQKHDLPLAGVIVENTFTSISDMVDSIMPYLAPFKRLVLRIRWDSGKIVPTLLTPILYLAGAKDQLVPHSHMTKLYRDTSSKNTLRKLHVVPYGTHNDTWMKGGQAYWDAIRQFMNTVMSTKRGVVEDESCENIQTDFGSSLDGSAATPYRRATSGTDAKDIKGSAIPIMPSNIMGIARESLREDSTTISEAGPDVPPVKKQI